LAPRQITETSVHLPNGCQLRNCKYLSHYMKASLEPRITKAWTPYQQLILLMLERTRKAAVKLRDEARMRVSLARTRLMQSNEPIERYRHSIVQHTARTQVLYYDRLIERLQRRKDDTRLWFSKKLISNER
jgi:hypothetical protein